MHNSYNANIIVHINEELSNTQIHHMERSLAEETGVISACVNERARHLWVIDYDPLATSTKGLLRHIHGSGMHAQIIGGV